MIGRFVAGLAAGATAVLFVQGRSRHKPNGHADAKPNGHATPDAIDTAGDPRQLVGIIAHELRTPTSVILGYQELLAGGLLGPVNERTLDALERIRRAAGQLRDLTDGLQILTGDVPDRHDPDESITDITEVTRFAVDAARHDAEARGITLVAETGEPAPVRADPESAERILDLLIAASIRAGADQPISVHVAANSQFAVIEMRGGRFDPSRDGAALLTPPDEIASGLALRLAIAQRIATTIGGSLHLEPTGTLRLKLPSAARR